MENIQAHGQEKLASARASAIEAERLRLEAQALMLKAQDLSSASEKDEFERLQAQAEAKALSEDLATLQHDMASRMARIVKLKKSEPPLD